MGKRSNFVRRAHDDYATPEAAVLPLLPHLIGVKSFAEPCEGAGDLVRHLERAGLVCSLRSDIADGVDALTITDVCGADAIITNVPWRREILHRMILHFQRLAPTWLLFDADWCHTKQSAPFLDQCSHIVSVGRLKWIPDSPYTGKDNACWYRFHAQHVGGPRFIGKPVMEAA